MVYSSLLKGVIHIPILEIEDKKIELTNLKKIFWKDLGLTKGDLIKYYIQISSYLLPYVMDRVVTMVPYPHGVEGPFFYQKNLGKERSSSISSIDTLKEGVSLPIIRGLPDLLYLANKGCIEVHPWFSLYHCPTYPDYAVFDLDPSPGISFEQVLEVSLLIKEILEELSLKGYPKTSGKRGLHIYLYLNREYTYREVREALKSICRMVVELLPEKTTLEWSKDRRRGVYLDYRQNGEGKTLAAPYSLRPTREATVSTPIPWSFVERGDFLPADLNIKTIFSYLKRVGDPFLPLLREAQSLPGFLLKGL